MAALDDMLSLIAQQMQQTNAVIRNQKDASADLIHGFYREARRLITMFESRKGFGIRPVVISPTINVSQAGVSGGSTDVKIAEGEDFLVFELRGYVGFNNWPGEIAMPNAVFENGANMSVENRLFMKAQNARLNITNKDTKVPITDTNDIPLSSIMPELGAQPMRFGGETRPAWIIPHGSTINVKVTLQNTTAAVVGGSTDYGAMITGVYLTRVA